MMSVFYNLARGKLKEVDHSNDLPIVPGSQVTDLAWENDRFTRNVIGTSLNDDQSNASMFHVNDSGNTDIARPQAFVEGVFPSTRVDKKDPGIANPSSFSSFFRANIANENSVPNFGTLVNNPSDKRKGSCATEEKGIIVPTNTSSSVCSTVEELCGNPAQSLKRKSLESDDHEGMTEDLEDESTGEGNVTLAKGRTSSKRGRIAEVHNLSERRRRDRINERMHTLQELIPNCDKVDKATLLDEAIEYMKTLQRQVQLMSMGAGLYVPPMTLPPHMQHIQATYMPHFYSTGQEMGCGLAMNPMARVPIMEVANFPGPSLRPIPERTSFQPMAGTSFSSFRHPSQSVPFLASCINADTMTVEIPCYIGQSNPDDSVKNDNLPLMGNIEDCGADKQKTIQLQSKEEELFKASNLVLTNNRPSDGRTNNKPSDGRSVDNVDLAK